MTNSIARDLSPNGRYVAYGGGYYRSAQSRDTSVRVWDPASGEVKRMEGHTELVMRTVWHPKTNLLASVGGDGTVKLWDPQAAREIATLKSSAGPGYLLNAAFSPDGRRLVVAGSDTPSGMARLEVFDVQTRQFLYSLDGHANVVCGVASRPDGGGSLDSVLAIRDQGLGGRTAPVVLTFEGHNQTVWTVAFSPDGKYLATGSLDLTAKIWDTTTGALVQSLPVNFPVFALAFNPEGDRLLTVGPGHNVCVWKVGSQLPENPQPRLLSGHRGHVLAVAWNPDNRWTASGGQDEQIILREASTGREHRRLLGHTGAVLALAFSPAPASWPVGVRIPHCGFGTRSPGVVYRF